MTTAQSMNVRGALASFAAAGTLSLLASQAVADSPPIETSAPPPKPALAPTALPAPEQAPLPQPAPQPAPSPTPEPPPPAAKPTPQPATTPAPPPEPEAKPAPEPATEPASPPRLEPAPDAARDAGTAAKSDGPGAPDAAPTVKPPMTAVDDADTERAQGHDGFARALAPPPNLAPLDGGGLDLSGLDLSSGEEQRLRPLEQLNLPVEQLQGLPLLRQAPGPGGEPPLPPAPCVLTNAGLVCTGAQNCVLTSGGAICIQGGIPCVVTSAGSQCVPGCALTSAGLVCPSGCTLTSAGVRCPVAGRVLGSAHEKRPEPTRRRKAKRVRGASVEGAPTFEAAVLGPPERGSRRVELPFTGAPILMQVVVACLLLAAGVLLARRTRARAR